MATARATSHFLKQTESDCANDVDPEFCCVDFPEDPFCQPEEDKSKPPPRPKNFFEQILLGVIDGTTSGFNDDCRSGLAESVRGLFTIWANIGIYDPRKLSKFTMATTTFTEATNIVYAYCDVSHLASQFVKLADYNNWEQYIVITSRIGAVFIRDFKIYNSCIKDGRTRGNGFDVGLCAGRLTSIFLDTTF